MRQLMRKKMIFFMVTGMLLTGMLLTGCGAVEGASGKADSAGGRISGEAAGGGDEASGKADSAGDTASEEAEDDTDKMLTSSKNGTEADTEADTGTGFAGAEPEQYTWLEYTVTLPEGWAGRCVMREHESGFLIYQKASYELDDTQGYICNFFCTREPVEYDFGKELIAYTDEGMLYYLDQPGDVACDTEDEKILGEYVRMCQQVPQLKASLQIAASGVHGNTDEYILPTSSILALDPAALADLSDNSLWIARNEIYARHGRQFTNEYLQQYFDRCTWYEGTISPGEFQESVLNQTERDNLQLLAAAEEEYDRRHPCPKLYEASETASEDLDGDGRPEEIGYRVTEQENGEVHCLLTVNGETYIANELVDPAEDAGMWNPTLDCFCITDIMEGDGVLEIAVLDEGPSEDPITFFFQYNGTLSYIGQVPGFPFPELNGGFNGFNGYGGITGCSCTDLIETAYVQDYRWYDGSRLVDLGLGWCEFLPSAGHVLYEDLPVYCEQEETSAVTVIPAQEEVFFLGTDRKEWILVKGKDGSRGYLLVRDGNIVALDKPAAEVFSGLQFSD